MSEVEYYYEDNENDDEVARKLDCGQTRRPAEVMTQQGGGGGPAILYEKKREKEIET